MIEQLEHRQETQQKCALINKEAKNRHCRESFELLEACSLRASFCLVVAMVTDSD